MHDEIFVCSWTSKQGNIRTTKMIYELSYIRGLLEKYPTFGREKETGLPGALDT